MARAWPFENTPEAPERIRTPAEFVERTGEGTVAVVIRIGLNDAQLVLIDAHGRWDRWVYHSLDEATAEAEKLGIETHEGEYPEEVRVRMNNFQRPTEDFDRAAYPEQGRVGPVIPYPENRPRFDPSHEEFPRGPGS
jgi:hypothetical protein